MLKLLINLEFVNLTNFLFAKEILCHGKGRSRHVQNGEQTSKNIASRSYCLHVTISNPSERLANAVCSPDASTIGEKRRRAR